MGHNLKIEGIYDQRTLKLLKSRGIRDFGFNFSPKSFNFIQEHIFLSELIIHLDPKDRVHLRFTRSNDPMIKKVIDDLKKEGISRENIYVNCDEWISGTFDIDVNYYLNYRPDFDINACRDSRFAGVVLEFSSLEDLQRRGILNTFVANFYTHLKRYLTDDKKIILRVNWNDNLFSSLFDYFDIEMMSFSIDSNIEICYRNVDLKKLTAEMDLIKKNSSFTDKF